MAGFRVFRCIHLAFLAAAQPRPRRHHQRRRSRDGGHFAGFEAAVVGMLLFASIAVYVSLPLPGARPSINPAREPLETLVGDLLEGLYASPSSEVFHNHLEQAIARAVQGNETTFTNLLERALPPGTECRLWLDNGKQARQLTGPRESAVRETVSQSELWRPRWAYAFALPGFDVISDQQPLPIHAYEVSQGALVKELGYPILAELSTGSGVYTQGLVASNRAAPTVTIALLNDTGQPGFTYIDGPLPWSSHPALNVSNPTGAPPTPTPFQVERGHDFLNITAIFTGNPSMVYTLIFTPPTGAPFTLPVTGGNPSPRLSIPSPVDGAWTMTGALASGSVTSSRVYANMTSPSGISTWTFQLNESAGKALQPGALLNLTFPSTFKDMHLTNQAQDGWRNITIGLTLENGAWVSAELNTTLSNSAHNLTVQARRPANGDALYLVQAALSNGASARSSFVLSQPPGATSTPNPIEHDLYLSAPKPASPGSTALWGAALPHPRVLPAAAERVTQFDVRVTNGKALFAGVVGVEPASGWQLVSPSHLRWQGTLDVPSNRVQGFAFRVTTVNEEAGHEPSITVPVSFSASAFTMQDHDKPYVYRLNVPPPFNAGEAQAGYDVPHDAGPLTRGNATFDIATVQRRMLLRDNVTYGVTTFAQLTTISEALRHGLGRSHVNLSRSEVKIGDEVNVTVDFQALYNEVTLLGASVTGWNVSVAIYDPAQPFLAFAEMVPSFKGSFGANGQLAFDPATLSNSIAPWALVGAADVKSVAQANFTFAPPRSAFYGPHAVVVEAKFVVTDLLGTSMAQSARQLAIIDVLPDSGQSGTSLYWVGLECWLQDW